MATPANYYDAPGVLGWVIHCHACLEQAAIPLYRDGYQQVTDPIAAFAATHAAPHLAYAVVVLNGAVQRLPVTAGSPEE